MSGVITFDEISELLDKAIEKIDKNEKDGAKKDIRFVSDYLKELGQ